MSTIQSEIGFPIIVKPNDDGCSVLVERINTSADYASYIETLFAHNKKHALIEECISGMELTVGVIGNNNPRALPPSQAVATAGVLSIRRKIFARCRTK